MTMPPLPKHPEIHSHRWTNMEIETIKEYGKACYQAGVDTAIEVIKCDTELVNAKAEIKLSKLHLAIEGETK